MVRPCDNTPACAGTCELCGVEGKKEPLMPILDDAFVSELHDELFLKGIDLRRDEVEVILMHCQMLNDALEAGKLAGDECRKASDELEAAETRVAESEGLLECIQGNGWVVSDSCADEIEQALSGGAGK
jgi:hypothetical protein